MSIKLFVYFTLTTTFFTCGRTQSYGELRFVQREDSESSTAGLLEIFLNDEWGMICDTGFDMIDASVACRQMGYRTAISFATGFHSPFGIGENGSVWLSNIDCRDPNGLHLLSCAHRKVGTRNCDHFSDIGVVCDETPLSASPEDGSVQLIGSKLKSQGFVEIACGREWRTACGSNGASFNQKEADAVCWQLGFTQASAFTVAELPVQEMNESSNLENQTKPQTWHNLSPCIEDYHSCTFKCTDTESSTCSVNQQNSNASYGIWVICNHTITHGTLRLVGGTEASSGGRLEVFSEGNWGTVCGATFGLVEANVACRQLGYLRHAFWYSQSEWSTYKEGPIALMGVNCTAKDAELAYCSRQELPEGITCTHDDDIILACTNDPFPPTTGAGELSDGSWPLPFSKRVLIEISAGAGFALILCCFCSIIWCTYCCCQRSDRKRRSRMMPLQITTAELNFIEDSTKKSKISPNENSETKEPDIIVLAATIQDQLKPSPIPCSGPAVPTDSANSADNRQCSPESSPLQNSNSTDSHHEQNIANNMDTHMQVEVPKVTQTTHEEEHKGGKDKGKQRAGISMEPIPEEENEIEGDGSEMAMATEPPTAVIVVEDYRLEENTLQHKSGLAHDWVGLSHSTQPHTIDGNTENVGQLET